MVCSPDCTRTRHFVETSHIKKNLISVEQVIILIEKRIIIEEDEQYGCFLDANGYLPRSYTMLNNDAALFRFKYAITEYLQLSRINGFLGFPRFSYQLVAYLGR